MTNNHDDISFTTKDSNYICLGVIDDYAQSDRHIYRHCNYLTESASGRFSVQVLLIFYIVNTVLAPDNLWIITRQGRKNVVLPFQSNNGLFCFPKSFIMCTTVSSGHWTRSYNLQSQTNTSETHFFLISSLVRLFFRNIVPWFLIFDKCDIIVNFELFVEIVFC